MKKNELTEMIGEIVSETLREARRLSETEVTLSHGGKVKFGHPDHIKDLKARIHDLSVYRDAQKRGTEARSTYARAVSRLRQQLKSAEGVSVRHKRTKCGVTRYPRKKNPGRPRVTPDVVSDDAVFESVLDEVARSL